MTAPAILSTVLSSFILLGVIGIVLVFWYWSTVGRWVSDVAVKVATTAVKYLGVLSSVGGAYAAAHRDDWFIPAIAGATCAFLWDALEKLIDHRVKATDKIDKQTLALAEKEGETRTELLTVFRRSVSEKTKRLMNKLARRKVNPSAVLVRAALTPEDHLDDLLQALAVFFTKQLPSNRAKTCNFRVGLYAARKGVMTPLRALNLNNPSYDVFSSYRDHASAFRLDQNVNPSLGVTCVNQRRTVIVENCSASAEAGTFHFFNDNQRSYLRSMLAYYLDQVCCDDGTMSVAALVIDTDAPGFFRERDLGRVE